MSLVKKTSKVWKKLEIKHSIKSVETPILLEFIQLAKHGGKLSSSNKDAVSKSHTEISSNGEKNR